MEQRTSNLTRKLVQAGFELLPISAEALTLNTGSLHSRKGTWRKMLLGLVTILFIVAGASAQQMLIKKNQVLTLRPGPLQGEVEQDNGMTAYRSLVQQDPFIELHFVQPIPANQLRSRHTFECEEVGIYTDAAKRTWTIGKRCKLHLH